LCLLFSVFHTGQRLSEDIADVVVDDDTPVLFLMPSAKGRGQCSLALITYLCRVQNQFMEEYCRITKQGFVLFVVVAISFFFNARRCILWSFF
jgi:hypothetical protein